MTTSITPAPTAPPASIATSSPPAAMPLAVRPDDLQSAAALLHRFDALALGEGDLAAGANTLAVMALTLACVAPPGSCLAGENDGTRIPVGMGMLVSGALSCDLADDRVFAVLHACQNHLYGHVRQWLNRHQSKGQSASTGGFAFADRGTDPSRRSPFERLDDPTFADFQNPEENFRELLRPLKTTGTREIGEQPTLFASVGSAEGLAPLLDFAHRGRLLVHAGLSDEGDHARLARICAEVMGGVCPKRSFVLGSVSGQVIITDPLGLLGELECEGGKGMGWLHGLLWLGDHAAAPCFEQAAVPPDGPQMRRTAVHFESAIETVVSTRLNFRNPDPMRVVCELSRGQAAWNSFLRGLEPRFPGITGTLRPLPASLVFGLVQLRRAAGDEFRPVVAMDEVTAFARLLALRMVEIRETMLEQGRRKRLEALAASIRHKLADGPLQIRDLMRKSHRLDAATCQQALERLADSGLVVRNGSLWKLADSKQSRNLLLDV